MILISRPITCANQIAVVGSYYGKLMARAEQDRRIAPVPYDPAALVWTSWDLGIRDATSGSRR